jgi:hypothetical protein
MRGKRIKVQLRVLVLVLSLVSVSCKLSNPIGGVGDAIQKIFENIARSITVGF